MAEKPLSNRVVLTLSLTPDVAQRLQWAAEAQKRTAAELAADLLDRYLPRVQPGGPKKGKIPYA
jgi:hypothetical protein